MPLWALWRRNWAVWLMPLTGLVVATWNNAQLRYFDHYPYWMASQKTGSLVLLGMITCVAGAAEGGWQRHGRLNERPTVRGDLTRFGLLAVMTWLPTALLLVIGVAAVGGLAGWQLWLTSLVSLFAWTWLGIALGVLLRAVVALPVSLLAAFGWFAFTPAIEPPWPRQLSGTWNGCCTPAEVPDGRVITGVLIFAAGLCLAAAVGVSTWAHNRRPRVPWAAAMAVPVVAALGLAGSIVHDIGYTPTQPRTDPVVCWQGTPEICLWPERRDYADADTRDLRTITGHWSELGIQVPRRLSEAATQPRNGTAPLVYNHSDTPTERVKNLALGLVTGCDDANTGESTDGLDYFTALSWLRLNSGRPDPDVDVDDLGTFMKEPMAEQVAHLNAALAAWECR